MVDLINQIVPSVALLLDGALTVVKRALGPVGWDNHGVAIVVFDPAPTFVHRLIRSNCGIK
jgi:hypothetical protein